MWFSLLLLSLSFNNATINFLLHKPKARGSLRVVRVVAVREGDTNSFDYNINLT